MEGFWIGELAERAGVSADTIRYYEKIGLMPEPRRSESGYRLYGASDIERLEFIGQAQALDLSLEEIGGILELVDEGRAPCTHVRERLRDHLDQVRVRIRELRGLERRLRSALGRAERAPVGVACRCRIIEGVAEEGGERWRT